MAGLQDDATPAPRRRRRAVRRAAGPPGPQVADSPDTRSHDADSREVEPQDVEFQNAAPAVPDHGEVGDVAATSPEAPAAHAHPHVPGPGHGAHPPGRDPAPQHSAGTGETQRRSGRTAREDAAERSLRSLVTTRSSQVSPVAAMRAREVALPSDADLAAAEAEVTIIRRHYVPPTALTAGRRPDRSRRRPGESSQ
ncbi:hypothetical protein ACVBEQ_04380 [Nakamurella sp. GG22]